MRCAILELEANLETFPVWFIFGGRLPQTRGVFSTVLLKSFAVCLYAVRSLPTLLLVEAHNVRDVVEAEWVSSLIIHQSSATVV